VDKVCNHAFDFSPEAQSDARNIKPKFWGRQTLEYKSDCKVSKEIMVENLNDIEKLLVKPDGGGKSDIQLQSDVAEYLARYYLVILVLSLIYIVLANDIHGKEREYHQRLYP